MNWMKIASKYVVSWGAKNIKMMPFEVIIVYRLSYLQFLDNSELTLKLICFKKWVVVPPLNDNARKHVEIHEQNLVPELHDNYL